jgi:hypothetical protein
MEASIKRAHVMMCRRGNALTPLALTLSSGIPLNPFTKLVTLHHPPVSRSAARS